MPPVQEQLLLTDTEQTGHQWVQGLRIKKTLSLKGYSSANQEIHILRTFVVACIGQNEQDPYNTRRLNVCHAEVDISQRVSDDNGDK